MLKFSIVIITYNEEKNIDACLGAASSLSDDIVIVDSYSTDKTEEICRSYKVRFIKNKFEGHIEQKNFAVNQAKYDHVLSLDADEVLSNELKNSIQALKKREFDGYSMNRLNNYCGKWIYHGGWYPDKKLRLWNRRKGKWGGINPHDKVIMNKGAKIGFLKGDILHFTYSSINEHIKQVNKFSDIAANAFFKKGIATRWINILFNPTIKFIRNYFFRLGFLDGFYGFVICVITAHETFLKYVKLRYLYKQKGKKNK